MRALSAETAISPQEFPQTVTFQGADGSEELTLTPSQQEARLKIHHLFRNTKQRVVTLAGPAGTGKTHLLKVLLQDFATKYAHHDTYSGMTYTGLPTSVSAPTGRAALRASQVLGVPAATIHRTIYGHPVRLSDGSWGWAEPQPLVVDHGVGIIDELSMVGSELGRDILAALPPNARLLGVGDAEQLMPVNDSWAFDLVNADVGLTEVLRHDGAILNLATHIREGRQAVHWLRKHDPNNKAVSWFQPDLADAQRWILAMQGRNKDYVLLCYSNDTRNRLNAGVRQALGLSDPLVEGERLIVGANNLRAGVVNGEIVTAMNVRPISGGRWGLQHAYEVSLSPNQEPILVAGDLIEMKAEQFREWKSQYAERDKRWVFVQYGYAVTIHKSQGSQWKNVGVYVDRTLRQRADRDPDEFRRLLYTAVTRASSRLTLFM